MASALVNNVGMSPESFLDCPPTVFPSYGWLSPRISFSRDLSEEDKPHAPAPPREMPAPATSPSLPPLVNLTDEAADLDVSGKDLVDFEFCLDDPVAMLPADELFSDGKLVPLQLASVRLPVESAAEIRSPEQQKSRRRVEATGSDPYVFSPKAPRCSSRWKELLGLKKAQSAKPELQKTSSPSSSVLSSSRNLNPRTLKHFLHRNNPKSSSVSLESSLSLPLLRDSDSETLSISSRLSLSSSSSSGPDHEDLPRLSLDSDKPSQIPIYLVRNPPRVRVSRPSRPMHDHQPVRIGRSPMRRAPEATIPARGASVDSPRMNSSGKIVFQNLERSSSSPSTFNGGPRHKHRGMERSYSANVRITPVLNVPVCSLRGSSKSGSVFGFGQLFSQQKKETPARNGGEKRSCSKSERA